jgi:hypothetical protein
LVSYGSATGQSNFGTRGAVHDSVRDDISPVISSHRGLSLRSQEALGGRWLRESHGTPSIVGQVGSRTSSQISWEKKEGSTFGVCLSGRLADVQHSNCDDCKCLLVFLDVALQPICRTCPGDLRKIAAFQTDWTALQRALVFVAICVCGYAFLIRNNCLQPIHRHFQLPLWLNLRSRASFMDLHGCY